jgi:protease II
MKRSACRAIEGVVISGPTTTAGTSSVLYTPRSLSTRAPNSSPGKELVEPDHDCKIYFHKIGTPAQDFVVYERPEQPTWQFDPQTTDDGRYLVIAIGDGEVGDRMEEQIVYVDLATAHKNPVALIDRYEAEYVFIGNEARSFFSRRRSQLPTRRSSRSIRKNRRARSGKTSCQKAPNRSMAQSSWVIKSS